VLEVSRRLLRLHAVLGGRDDVDVVWMVVRQPELLMVSADVITKALWAMQVGPAASAMC
jgi:hypothetical protein